MKNTAAFADFRPSQLWHSAIDRFIWGAHRRFCCPRVAL